MNIYVLGLLWVVGAAVVTGTVAYFVRRVGADEGRMDNNEAAGQVFTIVGGLHAVLIAFVLISLFDNVSAARTGSYAEADSLVAAYWASDSLPEPTRTQVHQECVAYATTVMRQEWPQMQAGTQVGGNGWSELDQLRRTVAAAKTTDDWQADRKSEAANQLWQVYQARQDRLTAATNGGVSSVVWFALIMGSIISVMLPYFFGGTKLRTHVIIVSTLAATITLLLFATYELQNPFSGGARISFAAFSSALDRLVLTAVGFARGAALAGVAALFGVAALATVLPASGSTPSCQVLEVRDNGGPSSAVLLDLPSGTSGSPKPLHREVNAIGYSAPQDVIYGIAHGKVVSISRDGQLAELGPVRVLGILHLPPTGLFSVTAGTVTGSTLYLRQGAFLYAVNVDPGSSGFLSLMRVRVLTPALPALGVDDFAVDPRSGLLYGVSVTDGFTAEVVTIDPATGHVHTLPGPRFPGASAYGSVVFGPDHALYAIGNQVHGRSRLYRDPLDGGPITEVASYSPVSSSDAAGCLGQTAPPTTPPPPPITTTTVPIVPPPPTTTTTPPPVVPPVSTPPVSPPTSPPAAVFPPPPGPMPPPAASPVTFPPHSVQAIHASNLAEIKKQRRWGLTVLILIIGGGAGAHHARRRR